MCAGPGGLFFGFHDHVLDEKGRTSLPKEFRDTLRGLPGDPWINLGKKHLNLYPAEVFEQEQTRILADDPLDGSRANKKRLFLGTAMRCKFDGQGRILLPPPLRKRAGLDREITIVGVGNKIEIWDRARHEAILEQAAEQDESSGGPEHE